MAAGLVLFENARLFAAGEAWPRGWLLVEGACIRGLGPGDAPGFEPGQLARRIDAAGLSLLPGFIDLHAHGAMGREVMDADPDGLREIARHYARHGTTGFLATTWTTPHAQILGALAAVEQVRGRVPGGASVLGVHLEGPYLNPDKTGAQDRSAIRRADLDEAREYFDTGLVRLITLAPEYPENMALVDECARRGIAASAGHTAAGLEVLREAAQRGLRHVTHTYNAMTGLGHRDLGTVGAVMALPELNAELIADNIHVHPAAQQILLQVKGPGRLILVTDSIRGAGLADGEYTLDNRTFTIRAGEARLPDGTLVGSVLTMERALQHLAQNSGRPLGELWPASSLNAAREIGLAHRKGSLETGKDADLALLDERFDVALTMVEGEIVYERV
ncbi:MAG: N-acetylglucosamine-6-phosphate deacetylase [Chloroflexota bacterium]